MIFLVLKMSQQMAGGTRIDARQILQYFEEEGLG